MSRGPVVLCALLFASAAAAQQERLRLEDLTEEALRRNPDVMAAQKRVEAARQRPIQEGTLPEPMLSFEYNSIGSPRPFAGIGREPMANAGVMVSQPVPFPGKLPLRSAIAGREADAAFEEYRMVRLATVSRVKQSYHRLNRIREALDILDRNQDLLRRFLRISEARYEVGRAAQQDIFRAQTQLSILETRMERLRQERESAEAEMNSILNRPPDAPIGRPLPVEPAPLRATLDELLAQAARQAPMLTREQRMIERAQLGVNLARRDYLPDFRVNAGYFNRGDMGPMYMARVDFDLPLFFWRRQRAGVAEQASELDRARHSYEAAGQTLNFRVKDDYLAAQASFRLMDMFAGTVIPQGNLTLESSLAAYETGAVDFLTVLTNFVTVLEYELNYQDELFNYLAAVARIEEMTGVEPAAGPGGANP